MSNADVGGKELEGGGGQQAGLTIRPDHNGHSADCAFSCFIILFPLGLTNYVLSDSKPKSYICAQVSNLMR